MYARVGLIGGERMKHQKEWHTCDRCGKEIIRYDEKCAYIKTREVKPLYEKKHMHSRRFSKGSVSNGYMER